METLIKKFSRPFDSSNYANMGLLQTAKNVVREILDLE